MMSFLTNIYITASIPIFIISCIGEANGIGCYVCSSRNGENQNCEDLINPSSFYMDNCKIEKQDHSGEMAANQCIKIKGTSLETNEPVVLRGCASNLKRKRGVISFGGDTIDGLLQTCEEDSCNSAKLLYSRAIAVFFMLIVLIAF